MAVIRIGRFDDFGGHDTLLMEGDAAGLESLVAAVEHVESSSLVTTTSKDRETIFRSSRRLANTARRGGRAMPGNITATTGAQHCPQER